MTESVDSVIEGFPYSSISKVEGEPTYQSIKEVEKQLIKNASSYSTELGGGSHGYLGLILAPAKYQLVTGHEFEPHPNPGSIPTFPEHPTQPQIAQISNTHKVQLKLWREQNTLIKALKKQLTNAFDPKHLQEIEDTYTGYNNVSVQDILTYLYERYGEVTPDELETAEEALNNPFDPHEPFGAYICKIEEAIDVAEAAHCPFTPQQIINKALKNIIKTQSLPEVAIREWRNKAATDKTWANFKRHFSKEVKDFQKDQSLTAKSTYNVANAANQALLQAQADFRSLTESLINEFQTAKQFSEDPQPQPIQQAHATTVNQDLLTIIQDLKKEVSALKNKENIPPKGNQSRYSNNSQAQKPWQYCWTHGANKSHNSKNCKATLEGHNVDATFKDRKGGSAFRCHSNAVKKLMKS